MKYDMISIEIDGFEFGIAMVPSGEFSLHNVDALGEEDCWCRPMTRPLVGRDRNGVGVVHHMVGAS